ncbi:MAG: DUF4160 domain-containing protein [Treponema sp.]|nr:DUF4160 domain-containing protein [Candidatus Treponema equifaecale]
MPKVFEENGFRYFFFSNEGNPLEPCHIHVRKSGKLAKLWVGDTVSLADNIGFSAKELNEILKLAEKNQVKIKEAWNEFFKGKCQG